MRYIQKSQEPSSFAQWKALANEDWQPTWENLQNPEKNLLKEALLSEQYYVCCYCCGRITLKEEINKPDSEKALIEFSPALTYILDNY